MQSTPHRLVRRKRNHSSHNDLLLGLPPIIPPAVPSLVSSILGGLQHPSPTAGSSPTQTPSQGNGGNGNGGNGNGGNGNGGNGNGGNTAPQNPQPPVVGSGANNGNSPSPPSSG